MFPQVSIIIPTYNRFQILGETLDSIMNQTYKNWECIVIDDVSQDYTDELMEFYCERDNRIRYVRRPSDRLKGANSCRNFGLELSIGKYINWFDSDDLMGKDFLLKGMKMMEEDQSLDFVLSDYVIFNEKTKKQDYYFINQVKDLKLDYFTGKVNFGIWIIWKKESLKELRFDETLVRAQELDFYFRIFSRFNLQWKKIDGVLVHIRRHHRSLTAAYNDNSLLSLRSELKVRRNILYFLQKENLRGKYVKDALKIYLITFHKLNKNFSLEENLKELKKIEFLFKRNFRYNIWEVKFIFFLLLFKVTRRSYQLKSHLINLTLYV